MKHALVGCALALSACFDFDKRLESCRDAGVWVCGPSDGGEQRDAGEGPEGLSCNGGWCWDHPRPTGVSLGSVWGTSRSDLWVGGASGTVLHFDGTSWVSHNQDTSYDFTSICGHGDDVYFGATTASPLNRLLKWNGAWSEVEDTRDDLNQLACGTSSLLMARTHGAWALDWASGTVTTPYSVPPTRNERCTGIGETTPGSCVIACMSNGTGTPFVRLRDCTGAVEFEEVDDAGIHGSSFGVRGLWWDTNRGLLAGLTGEHGRIWQRDAGWGTAWESAGLDNNDLYAGATTPTGSVAVGANGVVVDVTATAVTARHVASSELSNSYHFGVWAPPSGDAWMVSQEGCIQERVNGTWVPRSSCAVGFEDFATEPSFVAVSHDGLYRRASTGWDKVAELPPGQLALWENPDGGGFAHLTASKLTTSRGELPNVLGDAKLMYVVNEERVVVFTSAPGGVLVDTNLHDGAEVRFPTGAQIFSLSGEADGTVWATGSEGTVLRSTEPGVWAPEQTGLSGDVLELVTGFGRQWAIAGDVLATRPVGGAWVRRTLTQGAFSRVVAIGPDEALLLRDTTAALRINASFVVQRLTPPPTVLSGRIVVRGDEVWAAGWKGGLVRFRVR